MNRSLRIAAADNQGNLFLILHMKLDKNCNNEF